MISKSLCSLRFYKLWTHKIFRTSQIHQLLNSSSSKTFIWSYCRQLCSTSNRQTKMLAWQIHQYGGNEELTLSQTARLPSIHSPDEILVEVHAASVNPIDVQMRDGYGQVMINLLRKRMKTLKSGTEFPLILGRDFSGVVLETGMKVKQYKPGDQVWGALGAHRQGSHAQFTVTSEKEISTKPSNISHTDAASIPYVALTTWSALCTVGQQNENNTPGKRILIHAGSGGIGSFAIQLMKAWGGEVTTTCSTGAVEMVKGLGADHVIDYKTQNLTEELRKIDGFDVILDTLGGETMKFSMDLLMKWRNSKYITIVTPFLRNSDDFGVVGGLLKSAGTLGCNVIKALKDGRSYRWAVFMPNGHALEKVSQLVEDADIRPIVDKVFQFEELPLAFEKVSARHARGKTVIRMK